MQSLVGTEAHGPDDGLLGGVRAAYRENDRFDEDLRHLREALARGDVGVEVHRGGEVEYLDASDVNRLEHHLHRVRE